MAMNLDHILPGIGVRLPHDHRHDLVEKNLIIVIDTPVIEAMGFKSGYGARRSKKARNCPFRGIPGKTDDADPPLPHGRGGGNDGLLVQYIHRRHLSIAVLPIAILSPNIKRVEWQLPAGIFRRGE
jgi:hypothetical protein